MDKIDKNKIVFIAIDWMKHYKGITKYDTPLGTGGNYPKEQKHEIYNFLEEEGICCGFTPPHGKLNLDRICKDEIQVGPDGYKYIENVLVIFNGSNQDGNNRKIIGFYVGATIFNKPHENKNPNRIIKSNNTFAIYNVVSKFSFLFENENERKITLPYSKTDGYGYGQSNIWYADENNENVVNFRNDITAKIEKIMSDVQSYEKFDDEKRYFEGKMSKSLKEISSIKRNSEARKKCLEHYFPNKEHYNCKICGFDFESKYGEIGKYYIEIHHIKSHTITSREIGEHEIDPINDLLPVCSNCHSIIHRNKVPLKIKEIIIKN